MSGRWRAISKWRATFQTLLDIVRYSMARELLLITEMTIGDIADALAYTHQSSFAEAFGRWSGLTPSEWRTAQRN